MSLGLLSAAEKQLASTDHGVGGGQIPIDRQRALTFGNSLLGAIGDAEDHAQTIVGEGMFRSQ